MNQSHLPLSAAVVEQYMPVVAVHVHFSPVHAASFTQSEAIEHIFPIAERKQL